MVKKKSSVDEKKHERKCIEVYKSGVQSKSWIKAMIGYVPE